MPCSSRLKCPRAKPARASRGNASTVVPMTGAEILRVRDVLRSHVHAAGIDYLAGLQIGRASCRGRV